MKISNSMAFAGGAFLCGAGLLAWHYLTDSRLQTVREIAGQVAMAEKPEDMVLSPTVAALLSKEAISLADRKAFAYAMGSDLGQADRMAMLESIGNTPPNGLSMREWFSLSNAILDVLRLQRPAMPEFTDRLVSLWLDRDLDPTLRDYVFQLLREWVSDKNSRTVHEERPEKLTLIRQTFVDACTVGHAYCDPQSTTTGTALLALNEWATEESTPEAAKVDPALLEPMLLAFAGNPQAHRGVRATALQLCTQRGMTAVLPLARDVVGDASSELILRLAAISCLSRLGAAEDHKTLAALYENPGADPLVRGALSTAVRSAKPHENNHHD